MSGLLNTLKLWLSCEILTVSNCLQFSINKRRWGSGGGDEKFSKLPPGNWKVTAIEQTHPPTYMVFGNFLPLLPQSLFQYYNIISNILKGKLTSPIFFKPPPPAAYSFIILSAFLNLSKPLI